jgi:hypothetical protein
MGTLPRKIKRPAHAIADADAELHFAQIAVDQLEYGAQKSLRRRDIDDAKIEKGLECLLGDLKCAQFRLQDVRRRYNKLLHELRANVRAYTSIWPDRRRHHAAAQTRRARARRSHCVVHAVAKTAGGDSGDGDGDPEPPMIRRTPTIGGAP